MPSKSRKIWSILSLLSEGEKQKCLKWIQIELGNTQEYVQELANITLCAREKLDDRELWEGLYPNDPYNDPRLRKLLRDLCSYVEEFIAIESFRRDYEQKSIYLIREYRQREAHGLFENFYGKLFRELENAELKDSTYFRRTYHLVHEMIQYQLQYEHGIKPISFEALYNSFDAWWVHEKIALACTNQTLSALFPQEIQNALLNQAYEMISSRGDFDQMKLLQIHWKIYQLFNDTASSEASEILQWIENFSGQLPETTKKEIFELLLNYQIRQLNTSGDEQIAHTVYNLYQWGIREKLLIERNKLHWQQYKNIISICLQTHNYSTALDHLKNLINYLPSKEKEEAYLFNLSQYHLATRSYEEVLSALGERRFSKLVYEIPARSTLLQAYYELYGADREWLIPQLTNLIRFVKQQKLSNSYKQSYLNRFSLFRKLVKAEQSEEFRALLEEIRHTVPISRPQWLIDKTLLQLQVLEPSPPDPKKRETS